MPVRYTNFYRSERFYWIECDQCGVRYPEDDDDEIIAWQDQQQAHIVAEDAEWHHAGNDVWACPACAALDGEDNA